MARPIACALPREGVPSRRYDEGGIHGKQGQGWVEELEEDGDPDTETEASGEEGEGRGRLPLHRRQVAHRRHACGRPRDRGSDQTAGPGTSVMVDAWVPFESTQVTRT